VQEGRGSAPVEQDHIPFHFPVSKGFMNILHIVISEWFFFYFEEDFEK
jgi:hypothetical protein